MSGNPTMPLRIGVIGAGRIVTRAHLPVLSGLADAAVVALCEPDQDRARSVADHYGIATTTRTVDELLDHQLDAVLVACPSGMHAAASSLALSSGRHVLCEKPMATTVADAATMVDAAAESGTSLVVCYPNRFRPEVLALRRCIERGDVGEVRSVRTGWLRRRGIPGIGSWFTNRRAAGGGALVDLSSHLIDIALWLTGWRDPSAARCELNLALSSDGHAEWYVPPAGSATYDSDVESAANGLLVFAPSGEIFVEVSWDADIDDDKTYVEVIGTDGVARLDTLFGLSPRRGRGQSESLRTTTSHGTSSVPTGACGDVLQPFRAQWETFVAGARNGAGGARRDLEHHVATVRAVEALYRAAGIGPAV